MKKIISFFVDNVVVVNAILVTLFILGFYILVHIKKEDYPPVEINILKINTKYPGSSIRDTELLITKVLEDQLKGISGVSRITSVSKAGGSFIYVYLDAWGMKKYGAMQEIREKVSLAQGSFPTGANLPIITELKGNNSAIIRFQINSDSLNEEEMFSVIKEFQHQIEDVPGVSTVEISGLRDREIHIMFKSQKLLQEEVSISSLKQAISNYVVRESVGTLYSPGNDHSISILTEFTKRNELENINVRRNFESAGVNVSHFATIKDGFADRQFYVRGNLHAGITLTVYKKDDVDSIGLSTKLYNVVNNFKTVLALRYSKVPESIMEKLNNIDNNPVFLLDSNELKNHFIKQYGSKVNLITFDDSTKETKRLLNATKNNAILGMILVFIVLWFFLDLRIAFWTSVGIPLALSIALITVYFLGYSINNTLLFGVITVLGILVDDAIVMSENIYRLRSIGFSPRDAAVNGVLELVGALTSTLLTTIFAFLPLILINDLDFLFVRQIPVVIIICLIASLLEVFFSLPSHISHAKNVKDFDNLDKATKLKLGDRIFIQMKKKYTQYLRSVLKFRYWSVLAFILILISAIFLLQKIGFNYYPNEENTKIDIRLQAPSGLTLDDMSERVKKVETLIVNYLGGFHGKTLDMMFTTVGSGNIAPSDLSGQDSNKATIILFLKPVSKNHNASDIVKELNTKLIGTSPFSQWLQIPYINKEPLVQNFLNKPTYSLYNQLYDIYKLFKKPGVEVLFGYENWLKDYEERDLKVTNAKNNEIFKEEVNDWTKMNLGLTHINIYEPGFGPRQSDPIYLLVTGNNDNMRDEVIAKLYHSLEKIAGVYSIEEKRTQKDKEIFLNLDIQKMSKLGISASDVAESVKTGFLGSQVGSIAQAEDTIGILLILSKQDRSLIKNIENIPIPNKYGKVIPLKRIVNIELHQDLKKVIRENGQRISSLAAKVDNSITSITQVNRLIEDQIPKLIAKYPGINIKIGGQGKDLKKLKGSISIVSIIGFVGIFFTLLFIFRSIMQPLFIFLTIPFGLVGVVYAFYLHGESFSFFAIIGILGLTGVVINSSIVMVDYINKLSRDNPDKDLYETVIDGAPERFRAIVITTITSIVGLLPTVYGLGSSVSVLRPLAMAMAYGVLFGSLITLFLIPCVYLINNDVNNLMGKVHSYLMIYYHKITKRSH